MKLLGLRYRLVRGEHPTFISGRYAVVEVEGVSVGFVGEVHPQVLVNWGLEKPVVVAELSVSALFSLLARAK
jgi:phenylalanyl-tRNA synthetase beta chain